MTTSRRSEGKDRREQIARVVRTCLEVRKGEVLTDEIIQDRTGNIAMSLYAELDEEPVS